MYSTKGVDAHVVKLHLGLLKIFTKRIEDGMRCLMEVKLFCEKLAFVEDVQVAFFFRQNKQLF